MIKKFKIEELCENIAKINKKIEHGSVPLKNIDKGVIFVKFKIEVFNFAIKFYGNLKKLLKDDERVLIFLVYHTY